MHKNVPTQNEVYLRERIAHDVYAIECNVIGGVYLVLGNHCADNIDTTIVLYAKRSLSKPVIVATAGIQHGRNLEVSQERRKFLAYG